MIRDTRAALVRFRDYLVTVWYMRPRQVVARAIRPVVLNRMVLRLAHTPIRYKQLGRPTFPVLVAGEVSSGQIVSESADEVLLRGFAPLGHQPIDIFTVDWATDPLNNRLWCFTLHYMEWLPLLGRAYVHTGDKKYLLAIEESIRHWSASHMNMPRVGTAWNPYVVARRIINWAEVLHLLNGAVSERSMYESANALWEQTLVLRQHLEFDIGANHLLTNAKALFTAGVVLVDLVDRPHATRWIRYGWKLFWSEFASQIRSDGVHEENAPSYHFIVLREAVEAAIIGGARGLSIPRNARERLKTAAKYGQTILVEGDRFPLLNDSVQGYPPNAQGIVDVAEFVLHKCQPRIDSTYFDWWVGRRQDSDPPYSARSSSVQPTGEAFSESGYWVYRDEQDFLFFDCARFGQDGNLAHAHADALSIIVEHKGKEILCDPGVYGFSGPLRDHFRSTAAHNTIAIDGLNQGEFWGPFRVSHRPRVSLISATASGATGSHTGYLRTKSRVVHKREVRKTVNGWELRDELVARRPGFEVHLNLQFAPGIEVSIKKESNGETACFASDRKPLGWVKFSIGQPVEMWLETGWVSPNWLIKREAVRLRLRFKSQDPSTEVTSRIEFVT